MGYETQLLIGKDTGMEFQGATWFQIYATVDMCKLGNSELFNLGWVNKTPDKKMWNWYAPTGDGDTQFTEDRYGDRPRPVPLEDVVNALRADIRKDGNYRRLHWALALLENMQANAGEDLSVLMWGY